MRKVMFVTDSAMDLPVHYIKEHQIKIVPFYISFGEKLIVMESILPQKNFMKR